MMWKHQNIGTLLEINISVLHYFDTILVLTIFQDTIKGFCVHYHYEYCSSHSTKTKGNSSNVKVTDTFF